MCRLVYLKYLLYLLCLCWPRPCTPRSSRPPSTYRPPGRAGSSPNEPLQCSPHLAPPPSAKVSPWPHQRWSSSCSCSCSCSLSSPLCWYSHGHAGHCAMHHHLLRYMQLGQLCRSLQHPISPFGILFHLPPNSALAWHDILFHLLSFFSLHPFYPCQVRMRVWLSTLAHPDGCGKQALDDGRATLHAVIPPRRAT